MDNDISLREAKMFLERKLKKGTVCPCCNQFAKEYNRKLNSGMVLTLINVYKICKINNIEWLHIKDFLRKMKLPNSHDWTLLKFWGLLRPQFGERKDGSDRIGYYKITEKGIEFVEGRLRVPKYIRIYNQKPLGFSEEMVNIKECIGEKFNYQELMNEV